MRLQTLRLKNFKGIVDFTLDAQGRDVNIYGDNGTGKTTIADGICWLLFNRDYNGNAKFEIKRLEPTGEPVHHLHHEVEGVFDLGDGQTITLKKVYQEEWSKKRGSPAETHKGHTTDHYIDNVPVQQKRYQERVAEIVPEELFRLLTVPSYFPSTLNWEKRREILMAICGDVPDEEVIDSNPDLEVLRSILKNRSQDDHMKVVKATMAKINEQLKQIPTRIDEVIKGIPTEKIDRVAEEARYADINQAYKTLLGELNRVTNSGQGAELKKQLAELDAKIARTQSDYERSIRAQVDDQDNLIRALTGEIKDHKRNADNIEADIAELKRGVPPPDTDMLDAKMQELRDEWMQVNKSQYCYEETICPMCGQVIPEDPDAAAKFEDRKARLLAEINAKGMKLKEEKERLIAEYERKERERANKIAELEAALKSIARTIKQKESAVAEANGTRDALLRQLTQPTKEIQQLIAERGALMARLAKVEAGDQAEEVARINAELSKMEAAAKEAHERVSMAKDIEKREARAEELRVELRALSAEHARLAHELKMLEQFTETKVVLLEDRVAEHFRLARFKLFKQHINGGLEPCCEVLYQGVPYSSNLNNGARINVGLDIINTMSRHYGTTLPVVIDGAESVTSLIATEAQLVRMIVSEKDKSLRVEYVERDNKQNKEAV